MAEVNKLPIRLWGILATLFFVFLIQPETAYSQTCAPLSGMVSWWPGEGNANDIANSNSGTLVNGAAFAPGVVNQAFSFDGIFIGHHRWAYAGGMD